MAPKLDQGVLPTVCCVLCAAELTLAAALSPTCSTAGGCTYSRDLGHASNRGGRGHTVLFMFGASEAGSSWSAQSIRRRKRRGGSCHWDSAACAGVAAPVRSRALVVVASRGAPPVLAVSVYFTIGACRL